MLTRPPIGLTSSTQTSPDKPAYRMAGSGQAVSYRQLDEGSNRLAHYLRSLGVNAGDRIALMLENHPRYFEICWGAHRAGLIYTAMSTRLTEAEVSYIVNDCAAKAVIASQAMAKAVAPLPAALIVIAGLLTFSLIEYSFHRWLFHGPEHAMERGHRRHHVDPTGIGSLPFFLPPVFLVVLAALFSQVMPLSDAWLYTGGIAGGYFAYGQCHDWIHRTRFKSALARRWAAHHHIHHHHPDHNFGVTSPLWDLVFGTARTPHSPGHSPGHAPGPSPGH